MRFPWVSLILGLIVGVILFMLVLILLGQESISTHQPTTWYTELTDPDGRPILCEVNDKGVYGNCYSVIE